MKNNKTIVALLAMIMIFVVAICPTFAEDDTSGYYEWTFDEGTYTSDGQTISAESGTNSATLKEGKTAPTFSEGLIELNNASFYLLEKPITLAQDKRWRVEWKGKMETGTKYNCQTILGNDNAEQYIMYGSNAIMLGNKSGERVEIPCSSEVAYNETSYILEGDSNRRVRLTYQVSGEEAVTSSWYEYPESVADITVTALFGSYQNILYKGYLDYVRVWEEYPSYYEWTFDEGTYTSDGQTISAELGTNSATLKEGKTAPTFSEGLIELNNASFYLLEKPITLAQDKRWRVEWKGKMETGTKYNCQTILGNDNAEQYIMYGSNAIMLGNKSGERVEIPCSSEVAYKETSYILEGDSNRRVRLTYQVTGEEAVTSSWYEYPESVADITVTALFGSYQSILYKGYLDYVRVWEEYPPEYTYTLSDNKAIITGSLNTQVGEITIPDYIDGYQVCGIGNNAFESCTEVTQIELPEGIEYIGESAFKGCSALRTIIVPSTVTAIGDNAFERCSQAVLQVYRGSFAYDYSVANSVSYEVIDEPHHGIVTDFQIVDSDGNRIYGSDNDLSKDSFYLTGTINNEAKAEENTLLCVLALYDVSGRLLNVGAETIVIQPQSKYTMTIENGIHIDGIPAQKGMTLRAFLFINDSLEPVANRYELFFDGRSSGPFKILSIGNSFSIDASTMVHNIAAADGIDITALNLHIGGCTLEKHWENAQSGEDVYTYQINGTSIGSISLPKALAMEEWDYVSLQQGSHESNDFSKFWTEENPYLTNMSDYVKELAPQATQLIHETWAYQNQYSIERLGYSGTAPLARNAMFKDVKNAYMQAANMLDVNILPSGEAVQKALNEYGFTEEEIYRDSSSHLTKNKGRYLAGAIWYTYLTGNSIMGNTYQPDGVSADELYRLKQAVQDVTQMAEYKWD